MKRIGLLSPGEMGSAIGARLVDAGHRVVWASAGRGAATAARAKQARLEDTGTVAALVAGSDVVLSVVPPQFALQTAVAVAASGFSGLYVDANAIAPSTATEVATTVTSSGARFVDGGIVGPPPVRAGTTRLYLSGAGAGAVTELFEATPVEAILLPGEPTSASALKLAYAAWTKGSAALLLAAHELAVRSGVAEALEAEWERSQGALTSRLFAARTSAASKGWRWTPEMLEIAAAMRARDLPPGFHQAAASIFEEYPRPTD
ncbi:MAG: NAD(P)-dependent oxidoreductase [Candidatus Dormibacteraeota bacterium]|nr:NAD(P)-dependent oxidoreductase [Candidatus Dormibacteraeota bacterium]